MLTDLQIKNFAIIDALHVAFQPGLTVLTGETGAGKSIIIDAVNLLLGGRASAELIRSGTDEATVEALFDLSVRPELVARLSELGVETAGELVVKRVVSRSGKNRVFIGGGLSTTTALAELARDLVNIYGQHESQTLLRPDNHLILLDGFAGLAGARHRFAALFAERRALREELRLLEEGGRDRARQIDLLSFQSEEIGAAALQPGEDEELARERQLLVHGEKLLSTSQGGYEFLYGGDGSMLGQLQRVTAGIAEIAAIDPLLTGVTEALQGAAIQLEDAALTLRDYAARVEADPARLREVEDRLDLIGRLKRKYGSDIAEILAFKEGIDVELHRLRHGEEARDELDARIADLDALLAKEGDALTSARRAAAGQLKQAMEREIHELAMPHAIFETDFEALSEPRASGWERIEFLFSPNPGEEPRPLARVASGGELSRLMLALKQVHPESDVPTLVFDEVDSGIGGATSAIVGRKLQNVAREQQVLCITHLPQVAACADHHLRVEKLVSAGRTATVVTPLAGEERVAELARMLGGVRVTDTTLEHARELLAEVKR